MRSRALVRGRRAGLRAADPRRPARARDPGRRPYRGRARRPGRSAAAARARVGSAARADVRVAGAAHEQACGARRRLRRPGAAVPADHPHHRAPRLPSPARARRAAGDQLPASARGPPGPAVVAPGRPLGPSRADRRPAVAAADAPPARSAGRGRAPVDLARAEAARAGRPRDRHDRRPPPARHPRAPARRADRARAGAGGAARRRIHEGPTARSGSAWSPPTGIRCTCCG